MAGKVKRRLAMGCGVITLISMGFVIGMIFTLAVVGSLATQADDWKGEDSKRFIAEHLNHFLKLTPEQFATVEPLIREGLDERWELRQRYREETDRLFVEKYVPLLEKHLRPDQQERLQKRLRRFRKEKGLDPETGKTLPEEETAPMEGAEGDRQKGGDEEAGPKEAPAVPAGGDDRGEEERPLDLGP